MRAAVVHSASGLVTNVIELDRDSPGWTPPEGREVIFSNVADIGDTWNGEEFIKPAPVQTPMTKG